MKDTATIAREAAQRKLRLKAYIMIGFSAALFVVFAIWSISAASETPIAQSMPEYDPSGAVVLVHTEPAPLKWPSGRVEIYHNATGSPLSNDQAEGLIRYMSWSWQQRTGLQIDYAGLTNETEITGAIVLQWANMFDMFEVRNSIFVKGYTAFKYYASSRELVAARIVLLSDEWLNGFSNKSAAHTAIHELGHAIGIMDHSDNKSAIMYPDRLHDRYAVTAIYVQLTAYAQNICHAELTPHGDVYIPAINGAGVTLKPVDGILTINHEHHTGLDCSGSWNGSEAVIYDVSGYDGSYSNVRLKPVDDGFEIVGYD